MTQTVVINGQTYVLQALQADVDTANVATTQANLAIAARQQADLRQAQTLADRTQTGLDRVATGADRTQTGLDRTQVSSNLSAILAAWASATSPVETLAARSQLMHYGAAVATCADLLSDMTNPLALSYAGRTYETEPWISPALVTGRFASETLARQGPVSNGNMVAFPEQPIAGYAASSGVSAAATQITGFVNAVQFPASAAACWAYQAVAPTNGSVYSLGVIVQMDDNSAPVVTSSQSTGDFCLVVNNTTVTPTSITARGDGSYLVSLLGYTSTGYAQCGVSRYSVQSGKGFRIAAIRHFPGAVLQSYVPDSVIKTKYYQSAADDRHYQFNSGSGTTVQIGGPKPSQWLPTRYSGETAARQGSLSNGNKVVSPESFSDSNFSFGAGTVPTAGQADPNGGTTGVLVTFGTNDLVRFNFVASATNGTIEIWVKLGTKTSLSFLLRNSTTSTAFDTATWNGALTGTGWTTGQTKNGYTQLLYTRSAGITAGDSLYLYIGGTGNASTAGQTAFISWPRYVEGVTSTTLPAYVPDASMQGAYYQNAATGGCEMLTPNSGVVRVFRGMKPEKPNLYWVLQASWLVAYDIDASGLPMWMAFNVGSNNHLRSSSSTSIAVKEGRVIVGTSNSGAYVVDFANDQSWSMGSGVIMMNGGIGRRNDGLGYYSYNANSLASGVVNSVAATVLPDAEIDTATGLASPWFACGTSSGVSLIKPDGSVINSSTTLGMSVVTLRGKRLTANRNTSTRMSWVANDISGLGSSFAMTGYQVSSIPSIPDNAGATAWSLADTKNFTATGFSSQGAQGYGVALLKDNPSTPAAGMVAYISYLYNTGWLVGDIRRALLCDAVAETITGTGNIVTGDSSTFTGGVGSWAVSSILASTAAAVSGELQVTASVANGRQVLPWSGLVVGRWYRYRATARRVSGTGAASIGLSTATGSSIDAPPSTTSATAVELTNTFQATATTHYFFAGCGASGDVCGFDDFQVALAEPDRSVKGRGAIVVGTLTKSAVAAGAQLVAYSGFSASNYVQEPYSSDLDFGTGDFHALSWVNLASTAQQFVLDRATSSSAGGRIALYINASNAWCYSVSASAAVANSGVAATTGLHLVGLVRSAGVLYFFLDGVLTSLGANTANVSNTSAPLLIGAAFDTTTPTSGAIGFVCLGATAISANQAAFIYKTERAMFQPGAKVTIGGSSAAVTALSADLDIDAYYVANVSGSSQFKGLVQMGYTPSSAGSLTSFAAAQGATLSAGLTGAYYQAPSVTVREAIVRQQKAQRALGKEEVSFYVSANAGQTVFFCPKQGYSIKKVYTSGGTRGVPGTFHTATGTDGFLDAITVLNAEAAGHVITLDCVRTA